MKQRSKLRTGKLLFFLALISFMIASVEGALYYSDKEPFFRILLILQNGINAFAFRPSISLTDAMNFMRQHNDAFHIVMGYLYGITVFTAPYCTFTVVYNMLEKLLRMFFFGGGKSKEHILVFGYNPEIKAIIDDYSPKDSKRKLIHIITANDFSSEERFSLSSRGCRIHTCDIAKITDDEASFMLKKINADRAKDIILFDEDPIVNFSLLQMFSLDGKDGRFTLCDGAKITCRCEEQSIAELILDYYNASKADGSTGYELELVNMAELQVRKLFDEVPLHSYYLNTDKPLSQWHTRLLIAGFGKVGQEALMQAITLGVVHKDNKIVIDIFDTDIKSKMKIFSNRFSSETFIISGGGHTLSDKAADGKLAIRCHNVNVLYRDFTDSVEKMNNEMPFTYAFAAIDDVNIGVSCAIRLSRIFGQSKESPPIIVRMDSEKQIGRYINENISTLINVKRLDDRRSVLTLDNILNREINRKARQFHYFYSTIQVLSKGETPWRSGTDNADELWKRTSVFKRDSSKSLAAHDSVKQVVFERLAAELGCGSADEKIASLIGKNGSLMSYNGTVWYLNGTDDSFLDSLAADSFASAVAMLEHRRWCYFVASEGWKNGSKRDDAAKIHTCLLPYNELLADENGRKTIKYDLMALLARHLKNK